MATRSSDSAARIARDFYDRETALVARELLGKRLVTVRDGLRTGGAIVECEAYVRGDSTNHAARGRTARNASMFAQPGTAYVYFTYGMHYCMNLVTEGEGSGTAVLVRALALDEGVAAARARRGLRPTERDLCRGPARLCVALAIDGADDGDDTCDPGATVFVEDAPRVPDASVARGPRVGVVGDPRDVRAPLRFAIAGSRFVSDGPRGAKR